MNIEHINIARKAITDIHGTETPQCNVAGDIICPVCKCGTLYYSISTQNGKIEGECSTVECVAWAD